MAGGERISRRRFTLGSALGGGALASGLAGCQTLGAGHTSLAAAGDDVWQQADALAANIAKPTFPDRVFNVTDFGAQGNGKTDCTAAIGRAIAACANAGGGRVVVPAGLWLSGPIHLKSKVNLHLEAGSTLRFYTDPKRYLPAVFTRWEGVEFMGYSPLIYAFEQEDIAVTGEGVLDGGADDDTWWPWKGAHKEAHWNLIPGEDQKPGRKRLFAEAEAGVPPEQRHYGDGAFLRPPFVQPYRCKRVLIEGVTIINSPFWLLNPVLCEDVTIRKVTCRSHGPNNDGCDPESCRRVLIEHCVFDTGDDCIAIKSGRNADGRRIGRPAEDIVVRHCQMRDGHGGLVMGSEISGGVRNVYLENCVMDSPALERAIRIKTNARRGGTVENINVRDVNIGKVLDVLVVNFHYEEGADGDFMPTVRNINIRDLHCASARRAFYLRAFPEAPLSHLRLSNFNVVNAREDSVVENVEDVKLHSVRINGEDLETLG